MSRRIFDVRKETKPFTSYRGYVVRLMRILADCESVLDVGCGVASPLRFLRCRTLVGVDAHGPSLEQARCLGTHDQFFLLRAEEIGSVFRPRQFDACVALDVIEHLSKESGRALLGTLESLARRKVVVSTPNGFLPQPSVVRGDLQEHLSGWTVEEMNNTGYHVSGLYGWRPLRTGCHVLRFRPTWLWLLVSQATDYLWCRKHARYAAAMLCVKNNE